MRRVIFNLKGGVGKSTITCNLAAISAYYGKKTLVVDLDAQANSSQYLLGLDRIGYFYHLLVTFQILNFQYF